MARLALIVATLGIAVCSHASASTATVRWFLSPTRNISCEVAASDPRGTYAYCQSNAPARNVTLRASGSSIVCRGERCLGNAPENARPLAYGRSVRVGPFRCTSRRDGMRCVVVRSGHGFQISRQAVTRF